MTRILLQTVLPLLLPTLAFIGWIALSSKRGKNGKETFAVRVDQDDLEVPAFLRRRS